MQLDQAPGQGQAEAGPAPPVPGVPACSNSLKMRSWSAGSMPTPVSATAISTRSPSRRAPHGDRAAGGREADGVGQQVEDDLAQLAPSASIAPTSGSTSSASARPLLPARSRTTRRPSSRHSATSTLSVSRSMRPASILARSRMSVISSSRWRPAAWMSSAVGGLARGEGARGGVAQHVGEVDDGVQRRAQLVGHVGQEAASSRR